MLIKIGMENGAEGNSIAWGLDYPGCYSMGRNESEALLRFPTAFLNYANRITRRAVEPWLEPGDFDIRLVEAWDVYCINEDYEVVPDGYEENAWFKHDWKPLTTLEIQHALEILCWGREDLLELVKDLTPAQMDRERPGERWSIRGILRHVAGAEWWYLDRLDLAGMTRDELPGDAFERLSIARSRLIEVLPQLAGKELVRGKEGEFWSPRKLLRRALWHELDHIGHISRLILED